MSIGVSTTNNCGVSSREILPNWVFLATGEDPVWLETTFDVDCNRIETYFYKNINGDIIMTTSNTVGANAVPAKTQSVGSFTRDYFANGADLTKTKANIIADAIAASTQVFMSDGSARTVLATDFIAKIDVGLKPIGGHGDDAGTQVTATASDARYQDGGLVSDIDPGGSRESGSQRDSMNFYVPKGFEELVVVDGSIVTVSVEFASIPA